MFFVFFAIKVWLALLQGFFSRATNFHLSTLRHSRPIKFPLAFFVRSWSFMGTCSYSVLLLGFWKYSLATF